MVVTNHVPAAAEFLLPNHDCSRDKQRWACLLVQHHPFPWEYMGFSVQWKDKVTNMLRSSQVNQEMTQVIQGQSNVIQRRGYVIQQKSYVNKEHLNLLRIHSTCQEDLRPWSVTRRVAKACPLKISDLSGGYFFQPTGELFNFIK